MNAPSKALGEEIACTGAKALGNLIKPRKKGFFRELIKSKFGPRPDGSRWKNQGYSEVTREEARQERTGEDHFLETETFCPEEDNRKRQRDGTERMYSGEGLGLGEGSGQSLLCKWGTGGSAREQGRKGGMWAGEQGGGRGILGRGPVDPRDRSETQITGRQGVPEKP